MRRIRRPFPRTSVPLLASNRPRTENSRNNSANPHDESDPCEAHVNDVNLNISPSAHNNEFVPSVENAVNDVFAGIEELVREENEDHKYGHILKAIREVISCCACYASDTLMKECMNGHLICQNCFLTLRQDERPQCPTCRANLYSDSRRALIAQKVLSELPDICTDCGSQMLHKCLASHRLNQCPKRRVACGLSPLGCIWVGNADEYSSHHNDCVIRKSLLEQPIGDNLELLLGRFKSREQSMRETFQCFSTVLRHLEAHELQTVSVTLSSVNVTDTSVQYRSDHFHINQSRWTAEIIMKFSGPQPSQLPAPDSEIIIPNTIPQSDVPTDLSNNSVNMDSGNLPYNPSRDVPNLYGPSAIRRRRFNQYYHGRHHPYQRSFAFPPGLAHFTDNTNQGNSVMNNPQTISYTNHTADPHWNGEITYRLMKENSPGIGRKAYAFVLLQLRVPDAGVHIYARPQIQTHRFSSRGETTQFFTVNPIRWRYISSLSEMTKHRLVQAEFVIARRITDEHTES